MRREYYWTHTKDVYKKARDSNECTQNKPSYKCQHLLQLVTARGALEVVVMHILGPLPKTFDGSQYVLLMRDFFSKLKAAVPTSKTNALSTSSLSMDNLIIPCGIQPDGLKDI